MAKGTEANGTVPAHVAVIMDGNGRWAKRRLLPRAAGHRAGMNRMIELSEHAFQRGVRRLTLFALSTENLSRPRAELDELFGLFREYFAKSAERLREKGIRLGVIGELSLLPEDVKKTVLAGVDSTVGGARGTLVLALAYGSRREIVSAVNEAVRRGERVDEAGFAALLSRGNSPDPDLVIRTGGELRLSNFLLWQSAYAELYFSDKMFPDFSDADFDEALNAYANRDRRYGKL